MPTMEAQREYYGERLKDQGYVTVPTGVTAADIDPLFEEFRAFLDACNQPNGQNLRDALAYTPPNRSAGADAFVISRRVGDINTYSVNQAPGTEDKDVAHITPLSLARAEAKLGASGIPYVMRQFLGTCVDLQASARKSVRPVLGALGLEEVLLSKHEFEDEIIVRLLRYHGTPGLLANLHFDRSVATLAVHESSPGLVGTPGNNAQKNSLDINQLDAMQAQALATPIVHRSGYGKLFLGAAYNRLPDKLYDRNGGLPLLLHGVLNKHPEQERLAVVVFMHPKAGLPGYSVPYSAETGVDKLREHILRRSPPHSQVA